MKSLLTINNAIAQKVIKLFKYTCFAGAIVLISQQSYNAFAKEQANGPDVYTNQSYIDSLNKRSKFDVTNAKSVFQHILNSLPEKVKIYPTEGYYYFHFYHNGIKYAGNIRLDYHARKEGKLFFNYFKETNDWSYEKKDYRTILSEKQGVKIKEISKLVYNVSSGDKTVTFELVDLSGVKPPEGTLQKNETYIGPVYDESGIRFFLIFNPDLKIFHYILDETTDIPEEFIVSKTSKNIFIGRRTGFAFYKDPNLPRRILIAIHDRNASVNNYFDGPFDQLGDSFIQGDTLKNSILTVNPELKGKIDRFGNFSLERRYLISPYMYYDRDEDLGRVEECVKKTKEAFVYQCFDNTDNGGEFGEAEIDEESDEKKADDDKT